MNLRSGTRLGPYEIVAPLGAGGMGEVYKAKDTRLGRTVAIKILPAEFSSDAKLKTRFEREAKAISALNHAHICTLHDVGSDNGVDFLVMEYCEGQTLAQRLERGPLPLEQVLNYGAEIAEALEKAHRNGVIHRDLKPSNVMLTKSGVKLLDFGLAKQSAVLEGHGSGTTTVDKVLTGDGKLVGTIQYMAPETLTGGLVDARSDIFALGLVLYEMVTGKAAFHGSSKASLIAAILEHEPEPVLQERPNTPVAVDVLIKTCLAKDPNDRLQSAHDVMLQLRWLTSTTQPHSTRPNRMAFAGAAIVGAFVVAGAFWMGRRIRVEQIAVSADQSVTRTTIDLRGAPPIAPDAGLANPALALSPDGLVVAYLGVVNGETYIFKRRLDDLKVDRIDGTAGAKTVFFSPNGEWIGFFSWEKLMKIPVSGGAPVTLANVRDPIGVTWARDDMIYFGDGGGTVVSRVASNGGPVHELLSSRSRMRAFAFGSALPDGSAILLQTRGAAAASSGDFATVSLFNVHTGTETHLFDAAYDVRYAEPGFLTFIRGADLFAVGFDPRSGRITSRAELVQSGVACDSFAMIGHYSLANNGSFAYVPGGDRAIGRFAWVDRTGATEFLDVPERLYGRFQLSADDRMIVTEVSGNPDSIWVVDLSRKESRRLFSPQSAGVPIWSKHSRRVIALARVEHGNSVIEIDVEGAAQPKEILASETRLVPAWTSPRNGMVGVFDVRKRVVRLLDTGSSPPSERSLELIAPTSQSDISPDGRWLAYSTFQPEYQIQIRSLDDSQSYQLTTESGVEAVWCRECPELFYRVPKTNAWYSVRVSTSGKLAWGKPEKVWETDFIDFIDRSYDVSRDGRRLLVSKETHPVITDRIHLVRNWRAPSARINQ